jgi:hypothetical protein
LHLLELPLYFGLAWMLVGRFGIVGAAVAWAIRVAFDLIVLEYLANRFAGLRLQAASKSDNWRNGLILVGVALFICFVNLLPFGGLPLAGSVFICGTVAVWQFLLLPEDKTRIMIYLQATKLRRFLPKAETLP